MKSLVIFSPLPPKQNGIADYVAEQLFWFADRFECTVVIENHAPEPTGIPCGVRILRLEEYLVHQAGLAHAVHLYHVGNNPDHIYLLPVLYAVPGIVVLHDLNLHHLYTHMTLIQGNGAGYTGGLFQAYGRLGRVLGEQVQSHGWRGNFLPGEFMFNEPVLASARHLIVHSRYAAGKIRAAGHDRVSTVPHHLSPAAGGYPAEKTSVYREELGLPGDRAILVSPGFVARAKQIPAVLRALRSLRSRGIDFFYVLAGACRTHEYDVYADIRALGLEDHVRVTGFLDEDLFFKYLRAADVNINLRYPSGGETSGTLTRALGMGICTVIVDVASFSEVPDGCAVKLAWSETFEADLRNALEDLIENPDTRRRVGRAALTAVKGSQDIAVTTRMYREIIDGDQGGVPVAIRSGRVGFKEEIFPAEPGIRQWIKEHGTAFESGQTPWTGVHWWREACFPAFYPGEKTVLVGEDSTPLPLLVSLFGYGESDVDFFSAPSLETAAASPDHAGAYTRILANLSCSRLAADPVAVLMLLHVLCSSGGHLILTVIMHDHCTAGVPMTPTSMKEYLNAAGFYVRRAVDCAGDILFTEVSPVPRALEEWCFICTKCSAMIDRFPRPFYNVPRSTARWTGGGQ